MKRPVSLLSSRLMSGTTPPTFFFDNVNVSKPLQFKQLFAVTRPQAFPTCVSNSMWFIVGLSEQFNGRPVCPAPTMPVSGPGGPALARVTDSCVVWMRRYGGACSLVAMVLALKPDS